MKPAALATRCRKHFFQGGPEAHCAVADGQQRADLQATRFQIEQQFLPGRLRLAIAIADTSTAGFRTLSSGKFPTAARASFRVPEPWSGFGRLRCELLDYVTAESLRSDKD